MSSSISLATSADLETLTSKSFTDMDRDGGLFERSNTKKEDNTKNSKGQFDYKSKGSRNQNIAHFKLTPRAGHLKRYDNFHPFSDAAANSPEGLQGLESADFYEEVDERMSRNSVEYPEMQAKYVGRWVNDMNFSRTISNVDSTKNHSGNVVGIRGYPKDGPKRMHGLEEDQRSSFNKLKFNYSKLQTDYDKLRAHLSGTVDKFKGILKKKDHDIDLLKGFMEKRDRKLRIEEHRRCCANRSSSVWPQAADLQQFDTSENSKQEFAKLRHEHRSLELKLISLHKDHEEQVRELSNENDRLRNAATKAKSEFDKELNRLLNQVQALSLEPGNKMIISLRQENSRLKGMNELGKIEFKALKENYQQLESNLRALIDEQRYLTSDKDEEMSKIMVELCRLQVYQPKLEATLDTERAIKTELQARLEALKQENDHLNDLLRDHKLELNKERTRANRIESSELEALQAELAQWHDKFYRLKKEKSDFEELLRASKLKLASLDARHRSEMDLVNETNVREIGNVMEKNIKLEEHCNGLGLKLGTLEMKLNEYSLENRKLTEDNMELNKKLLTAAATASNHSFPGEKSTLLKRLKDSEELGATLRQQLEVCESKNREMLEEYERIKGQFDRTRQQVEQFRDRFRIQQKTLDEMKENRDNELAKLRVSLNFERYNKQVALKGIEKELRSSLRELEAMKCRFSRRLATQNESPPSNYDRGGGGGRKEAKESCTKI